jgi:hypothetical protein
MPDAPRPVSLCASLLEHLRRPIPLRFQSGPFARRELRAVSLLGWILLAVGVLGTYAAVSEGCKRGAVPDTIQFTVAAAITVASGTWLRFLVGKHVRAMVGTARMAR